MKRSTIGRRLAPLALAALLTTGTAWAQVAGVVTAVGKRDVTVSGAHYDLDGVELQDMTGHPISLPELRPGIAVELDFDEDGKLAVIRAAVVR